MKEKKAFFVNKADGLMRAANHQLDNMEDEGGKRHPNKYSFILLAAASLECMLNDAIVNWAFNSFPRDDYKRHAMAFLGMTLRGKLDVIGYFFSNGEFITDNSSEYYQELSNLIKLRNEIAHSKDYATEVELEIIIDNDGNEGFHIPPQVIKKFEGSPLIKSTSEFIKIYEVLFHIYEILIYEEGYSESPLFKKL